MLEHGLVERWLRPAGYDADAPDPDGWAHFTLYDLGSDLYGRGERARQRKHARPDGSDREHLRASLLRLQTTLLTVKVGEDRRARRAAPITELESEFETLASSSWRRASALRGKTFDARLASWLMDSVRAHPLFLDYATLRRLRGVAKRTWVFLEAEDWRTNPRVIGLGDPALRVLGVGGYKRFRDARRALEGAGRQIADVDPRYRLEVRQLRIGWQLRAERRSREEVRAEAGERRQARAALAAAGFP
ncbi:MAG: hypothetical protein M3417_08460, partial [Actinomycetota bacterium]|nr:hypothetical protein [Actinomycetota bacterium]